LLLVQRHVFLNELQISKLCQVELSLGLGLLTRNHYLKQHVGISEVSHQLTFIGEHLLDISGILIVLVDDHPEVVIHNLATVPKMSHFSLDLGLQVEVVAVSSIDIDSIVPSIQA